MSDMGVWACVCGVCLCVCEFKCDVCECVFMGSWKMIKNERKQYYEKDESVIILPSLHRAL